MQIAFVDIIFWIAVVGAALYIPALFALMVGYAIWDAKDSKKTHYIYGFPPPGSVIEVIAVRKSTGEGAHGEKPNQQVDET